ncbi:hypothetical protein GCM10010869_48350 [Mesorhizobium tianshanense]|uniref:hypothetical protein n=1 Tax=Mesorhizobium tianshanense TaxID=39844 RepID=UPI001391FFAB|nr:hypothetical protein [Mesorhizobium tianshanense]GLS39238.1 hypothetical protein GCM10010869_48350 [Mesorhizobium tianshanense]
MFDMAPFREMTITRKVVTNSGLGNRRLVDAEGFGRFGAGIHDLRASSGAADRVRRGEIPLKPRVEA